MRYISERLLCDTLRRPRNKSLRTGREARPLGGDGGERGVDPFTLLDPFDGRFYLEQHRRGLFVYVPELLDNFE